MINRRTQNSTDPNGVLNPETSLPTQQREQLVLDLGHTASHGEDDFIVSTGNQRAFDHVLAYPEWPGALTVVIGPAKSGKSHLAGVWVERSGAIVAQKDDLEKLAGAGGTQPVLVEDADQSQYQEEALFHFLNQSMRDGRPILMTGRLPVDQWPYKTADVLSRVRRGAQFHVEAPDDIQLSQMFVKLFDDRQVVVDPKIIGYLIARMERSTDEVVQLVTLMDKLALTRRAPITRTVAAQALEIRAEAANAEVRSIESNDRNE